MNIGTTFVTDSQTAVAIEPTEGPLNHPTVLSKVRVFPTAFLNSRLNLFVSELLTEIFRVICLVTFKRIRAFARTALRALNRGNGFDGEEGFFDVVDIGRTQTASNRDSLLIRDKMAFSPRFGAIRGVRTRLKPPFGAATLEESIKNFLQSMWPSWPSSLKQASWIFFQIPSLCHFASLRQALMPEPQPISWGRSSQGIPVFKTNTMAVKTCRLGIGGRPLEPGGLSGGSNGSILFHSSSFTIVRAIGRLLAPYGYRIKLGFC